MNCRVIVSNEQHVANQCCCYIINGVGLGEEKSGRDESTQPNDRESRDISPPKMSFQALIITLTPYAHKRLHNQDWFLAVISTYMPLSAALRSREATHVITEIAKTTLTKSRRPH